MGICGVDLPGSGQVSIVGSCEHSNEPLFYTRWANFLAITISRRTLLNDISWSSHHNFSQWIFEEKSTAL